MGIQARIPAALCVIHNFPINDNDNNDNDYDNEDWRGGYFGDNVEEDDVAAIEEDDELEYRQGSAMRDRIASAMWDHYQRISLERAF